MKINQMKKMSYLKGFISSNLLNFVKQGQGKTIWHSPFKMTLERLKEIVGCTTAQCGRIYCWEKSSICKGAEKYITIPASESNYTTSAKSW